MRTVFFTYWGTIGDRVLEWLLDQGEHVVAVVTRPGGPGETAKEIAFRRYVPLLQPPGNVNETPFLELLRSLEPDLFISMYFGRLFGPELLAIPKIGCVNMHPSLLPKYRGQGPTAWAIINGDTETGQTVHWLDEGIDTGDIIAQKAIPIAPDDTGATLSERMQDLGIGLFQETWPLIKSGDAPHIPQDNSQAIYCVAPRSRHARIDWHKTPTGIRNLVRTFTRPGRGAQARINNDRLRVWEVKVPERPLSFSKEILPGEVLAVTGEGVLVQTGGGQLLLADTEVGRNGPDLFTYLGRAGGQFRIILG